MNYTLNLINQLSQKGIVFTVENNELIVKAEKGIVTHDILVKIKSNKQQIISLLGKKQSVLSFAQERLWFLDKYNKNASYNMTGAVRLLGKLQISVLKKALLEIVRRHEILRTNFVIIKDIPKQLIHNEIECDFNLIEVNRGSKGADIEYIYNVIEKESKQVFDLANDRLFKVTLFKIDDEEFVLSLNKHHIISDGWSFSVFFKEVSLLYKTFSEKTDFMLEDLPIQYSNYAIWQREQAEKGLWSKQSEFWKSKLENVPLLELPLDNKRPQEQTYRGNNFTFMFDKVKTESIIRFSKENNVTLFMTMLSFFKVLLYKYSGQKDICLGSPIANRTKTEIENLIGFFVNTLALRSKIKTNKSFLQFLEDVKLTTIEAYENQDIPFEKVVDAAAPKRELSHTPIFQAMIVLQNTPAPRLEFSGIDLEFLEFESKFSKFDITLHVNLLEDELKCVFEYNSDLFKHDTIERLANHLKVLVDDVLECPERKIKDLSILNNSEKQQVLFDWNNTSIDYPKDICVHQLFEKQVEQTPGNTAVVYGDITLTYTELNKKANQLANYLNEQGVGEDDIIGLCTNRSIELIIGILGVLKAGGAYLPIDPSYPIDRIKYMLEDSSCPVLLTDGAIDFSEGMVGNAKIINLRDSSIKKAPNEIEKNTLAEKNYSSNNLAYVIYTSGSTGKPKGTMVTHQNFVNYIHWAKNYYFKNGDIGNFGLFTSISFDLTTTSIFLPLIRGKNIEIFSSNDTITDILIKNFTSSSIDCVKLTPSHISVLSELKIKSSSIKLAIVGGEELQNKHVRFLKSLNNEIRIVNEYGPTEATVGCIVKTIEETDEKITIGKPISNTQIYILKDGAPAPIGVPGEMFIAGDGVAKGYLNRAELSAQKFIINPYKNTKGALMYKTGDLARYLQNGEIEFLGRIDNQVKIRGLRIELGEIENVLNSLDAINIAVATVKKVQSENKRLVAYIILNKSLNDKTELSWNQNVRQFKKILSEKLPEYMIPADFIKINNIPLTPNGKINYEKLPDVDKQIVTMAEFEAPSNEIEEKIADIWKEVLELKKIGVNDNFFELGGHSILSIQVMSKINKEFQTQLPVSTIFKAQTIKSLTADFIMKNDFSWSPIVPIQEGGAQPTMYCISGTPGNVICFKPLSNYLGKEQPVYGLQYSGLDYGTEPLSSVEAIASQNIIVLKEIQKRGPYYLCGHSFGGLVAFEMARQLIKQGEEVLNVMLLDSHSPVSKMNYYNDLNPDEVYYTIVKSIEEFLNIKTGISLDKINSYSIRDCYDLIVKNIEQDDKNEVFLEFEDFDRLINTSKVQAKIKYNPPCEPYNIPITLFRAENNDVVDLTLGWKKYSIFEIDVVTVPGEHVTMIREPFVESLADKINNKVSELMQLILQE